MLFQKLYNWIKYKTLPPSVLFKNRLFIERDSKTKKIMNNFGLIFRNSKWGNYENNNIDMSFKKKYINVLFYFFVIFTFLFFLKNSYLLNYYVFNNFCFIFWLSLDSLDYYLSFLVWTILAIYSSISTSFYSFFLFRNFNLIKIKKKDKFSFEKNLDLKLSKNDLNWILYAWLNNKNKRYEETVLESLFSSDISKKWWNNNFDFFIYLYKTNYYLSLISEKKNFYSISNSYFSISDKNFNIEKFLIFVENSFVLNKFSNYVLSFYFKNYVNQFHLKLSNSTSLNLLNKRFDWNLDSITSEIEKNKNISISKHGLFYLFNLNQQNLIYSLFKFPELGNLNLNLLNQNKISKWNRWLYRYSILHRKLLKNSHKITLIKKTLNSGFYNHTLFKKNIWAMETFKKLNSKEAFFSTFFNLNYSNLFINKNVNYLNKELNILNLKNKNISLNFFKNFEQSYFWFIKRFYFYNTLNSNIFFSNAVLNNKSFKNTSFNDSFLNYNKISYFFLKNLNLNVEDFLINISEVSENSLNLNLTSLNNQNDFLYVNSDYDFLNKNTLPALIYITSTNSYLNLNYNYFSYFNAHQKFFNFNKKFYSNNFKPLKNFNSNNKYLIFKKALFRSLINENNFYQNDLYCSTFFL